MPAHITLSAAHDVCTVSAILWEEQDMVVVQLGGRSVQLLQQRDLLSGIGWTLCFWVVW